MAKHRYYSAAGSNEELRKVEVALKKRGYVEHDPCYDEGEELQIFIDTERMEYWYVDKECMSQCCQLIEAKDQEYCLTTNLTAIKNGEI